MHFFGERQVYLQLSASGNHVNRVECRNLSLIYYKKCVLLSVCINIFPPQNELLSNDVTYILITMCYCTTYKNSASNLVLLLTLHPEIPVAFPVRCSRSTSLNQNARHTAVPWSDCKPLARNLILNVQALVPPKKKENTICWLKIHTFA